LFVHLSTYQELVGLLLDLKAAFGMARSRLREMGQLAGVGIEPPQQTELCDATEAVPGVLCAGVPGAGGIDAIFAITLSSKARERVEGMWSTWHEKGPGYLTVCPLVLDGARGPGSGVRSEALSWD
jgi:phosphomevalonate kinase